MQNKTLGSTLIVAGTTIGAGMLAMPLTSAGIGFGFTTLLLVSLWLLLAFSALLFPLCDFSGLCFRREFDFWWRIANDC